MAVENLFQDAAGFPLEILKNYEIGFLNTHKTSPSDNSNRGILILFHF